jgi:hypothetical protein
MSSIPPLQDWNLDAPEDPRECPECDAPLTQPQCVCGYEIDDTTEEDDINAEW